MISNPTVHLLKTAKAAIDLKRISIERETRRTVAREIHTKQFEVAEKDIAEVIAPEIAAQLKSITDGLERNAIEEKFVKHLPGQHNQMSHGGGGGGVPKFDTVKEAETWANGKLAKKVDYSGIEDARVANKINEVMHGLQSKYKGVELESIRLSTDVPMEEFAAASTFSVSPRGGRVGDTGTSYIQSLTLNANHWKDVPTLQAGQLLTSHTSLMDKSVKGSLTHEYGHLLAAKHESNRMSAEIFSKRRNDYELVSDRAKVDHKEALAEVFVLYDRGGSSALNNVGGVSFSEYSPIFDSWVRGEKSYQSIKSNADSAHVLVSTVFNPAEWKERLINKMLPIMAIKMAEAAVAQMVAMGVDPRSKGARVLMEKHLPNEHNQMSHGRMGGTVRDKDGNLTMTDGSPIPSHIPKIPPAWQDVKVALDPKADVLVKAFMPHKSGGGRSKTLYSEKHWTDAAKVKFAATNELRKKSKAIRKEIDNDIVDPAKREEASCLRLIQATGMRPGGKGDGMAAKKAYGATTIEGRHIKPLPNGNVRIKYIGKKGVPRSVLVTDKAIVNDLMSRKEKAGNKGKVFDTYAAKLSKYSHTKDGGGFKTSRFRTAVGTSAAVDYIKKMKTPKTQAEYKKAVATVAKKVSKVLGNTPKVAKDSYIDPAVFSAWRVK